MQDTETLIRKLAPIIGQDQANEYLREYNASKFSPILKKDVEYSVRKLAHEYDIDNQIVINPVPKRYEVGGEYRRNM